MALLGLFPRHPYSAVPDPSNWQLWRNSPNALQQWSESPGPWQGAMAFRMRFGFQDPDALLETAPAIVRGDADNMTVSWRLAACPYFGCSRGMRFDDDCCAGRRDRLSVGRFPGG